MYSIRMSARDLRLSCVMAVAVVITACGGGSGGGATESPQTAPPPSGSNAPPSIQGQPGSTVLPGQAYSFQPAATDPNGDTLTFSVANLPNWASFSTSTGRVSGTPTAADIGAYAGITIMVSDGAATATMPAFSITVAAVASGSATLSWLPPTQNTDGSALTNLAGYEVRYGRAAGELDQAISITNASLSTYVVENLTQGTWYFAVVALNSQGIASPLSNVASKTIS